jgi:light-regulated signal transduction histidine kinase (bacteriophytochrome)
VRISRIEVAAFADDAYTAHVVCDNGIGFDMRCVGKLFGVFRHLPCAEDFVGAGIGLSLTGRVLTGQAATGRGAAGG